MRRARGRDSSGGFTLLELMVSAMVVSVGLLSLGGAMVSLSHRRDQASTMQEVLESVHTTLEQVEEVAPEMISTAFNGRTVSVNRSGQTGYDTKYLYVSVNSSNPKLLQVTTTATWTVQGKSQTMTFTRRVYNPKG